MAKRKGLFDYRADHVCLSVPDLDASIAWYGEVLGFEVESRFQVAAVPADGAMLRRGDFRDELFAAEGTIPLPEARRHVFDDLRTHGAKHLALQVDDLAAVVAVLKAHGVDFAKEMAQHSPDRAFAFIRDNSGNLIENLKRGPARSAG